jgi:hypothetical protein
MTTPIIVPFDVKHIVEQSDDQHQAAFFEYMLTTPDARDVLRHILDQTIRLGFLDADDAFKLCIARDLEDAHQLERIVSAWITLTKVDWDDPEEVKAGWHIRVRKQDATLKSHDELLLAGWRALQKKTRAEVVGFEGLIKEVLDGLDGKLAPALQAKFNELAHPGKITELIAPSFNTLKYMVEEAVTLYHDFKEHNKLPYSMRLELERELLSEP